MGQEGEQMENARGKTGELWGIEEGFFSVSEGF